MIKNPRRRTDEPDDHVIGRSRGGLTTKTPALVDGLGRPHADRHPGQAGDSPVLPKLLAKLRVARPRPTADPPPGAARQGVLPPRPPLPRHHRWHPRTGRPDQAPQEPRLPRWATDHRRRRGRQEPQHGRAVLQPEEALTDAHQPLPQENLNLPRRNHPRRDPQLAAITRKTHPRTSGHQVAGAEAEPALQVGGAVLAPTSAPRRAGGRCAAGPGRR